MQQRLLATTNNYNWLILRVSLGVVMLGHGLQKAFGWFGGYGWNNTMGYFTGTVGLPAWLSALVILIESLGALLLLIGFAGRINAALMAIVMAGAFFVDHLPNGFFMNWFGSNKGEGYEFDILFWAIAIVITINGSGKFSVDRWLTTRTGTATQRKTINRPAVQ
ncbi:DoxX family protein [Pseudoflavitalea sp. X16]|uniref:DoxX family protein n=1 Tax=Paraflavitalea devenefica TaxID=2716334 RepID=UPI001423AE44|nr:DoxX family protein [Paraflavitalea devenefica]NII27239.1 DoxX family protein [Paraflavitalea devenefica]